MNFNPDDPKYTAYVLGELSDADRAAVDAELHADPRVAALVAEIQTMTQSLAKELRTEALPTLAKNQREEILAAANTPVVATRSNGKRGRRIAWIMAISASLLLAAGGGWVLRGLSTDSANRSVSSNSLKQLGLAMENYEDKRPSVPPSYGGVSPSAVTGLDPTGSAPRVQDIQFRQGGFTAATPPLGGFDAASMAQMQKASSPTPSQTSVKGFQFADDGRTGVGGQGLVGQSLNPLVGADNSVNTVALGTNYYAGGTVAKGGTVAWTANSGSDRGLPHAISIAGDGSGIAGPGPGIVMNNSNSAETARILTLKSNTSPSAMKTALLAVLGDQARAAGEREFNTESYDPLVDNQFLAVADNPLSTFSIDVDTASYSNLRRFLLQQNQLPPAGAVRIEELINYFHYEYPQPEGDRPFSVTTEVASCPWQPDHRLVRIGLKGAKFPPTNGRFRTSYF